MPSTVKTAQVYMLFLDVQVTPEGLNGVFGQVIFGHLEY
jgi:hypothetical protein